jgi:hypothetical protein
MSLDNKVEEAKRELNEIAHQASQAKDYQAHHTRAFNYINTNKKNLNRQTLIRYYYKSYNNYKKENNNG